jgi:hypothetical protein
MPTASLAAAGTGFSSAALAASGGNGGGAGGITSGLVSVVSGIQATGPISLPAEVCGSTAAVLGVSPARCQGSSPISALASVCGNEASALGDSAARCEGAASVQPASPPPRQLQGRTLT